MHILLIASAFNSLSQRVFAELRDRSHTLAVCTDTGAEALRQAARQQRPDLVLAPMLTSAIPEEVFTHHTCLVVHPGPAGDRGPSSLDWALCTGAPRWGVTVLQANAEMDAGDVWATVPFPVPQVGKSDLYRDECGDAALQAVLLAVDRFASGTYRPSPQGDASGRSVWRPRMEQSDRRIDWTCDSTDRVLRTLRAADSRPGVLDRLLGAEWFLHGGYPEDQLRGEPGELLATRTGAVCRATVDGAVWIPELRARRRPGGPPGIKLPAVTALGDRMPADVAEVPAPLWLPEQRRTWSDIRYAEDGPVGYLHLAFPSGAMGTDQCRRLLDAYRMACTRPTSVLVIGGERGFFSNGIHLNLIEAADDPAQESWANINAMDDLVEELIEETDRLVVSALGGNAAAGGVSLARAADEVWCRFGVVLNPHYRRMGLYGSEYWTYLLPGRLGAAEAERVTEQALPWTARQARDVGLVDRVFDSTPERFGSDVVRAARELAADPALSLRIGEKKARRERDEAARPLREYRAEELWRMRRQFFSPGEPYHALRGAFVYKRPVPGADPVG